MNNKKIPTIAGAIIIIIIISTILFIYQYYKKSNAITEEPTLMQPKLIRRSTEDNLRKNNVSATTEDMFLKSAIRDFVIDAVVHYGGNNNSFMGYSIKESSLTRFPKCSEHPIIHVSPDNQSIVIFGRLCSDSQKYFCASDKQDETSGLNISSDEGVVEENYISNNHYSCK